MYLTCISCHGLVFTGCKDNPGAHISPSSPLLKIHGRSSSVSTFLMPRKRFLVSSCCEGGEQLKMLSIEIFRGPTLMPLPATREELLEIAASPSSRWYNGRSCSPGLAATRTATNAAIEMKSEDVGKLLAYPKVHIANHDCPQCFPPTPPTYRRPPSPPRK